MINKVQGVDDKLDQVNRSSSPNFPPLRSEYPLADASQGTNVESLLRWLSPPDPSTTHNIACDAHHNGTALWFLQSSIFNQWKSGSSFCWLYGTHDPFGYLCISMLGRAPETAM